MSDDKDSKTELPTEKRLGEAFEKSGAQFGQEGRVVARGGGQRRVEFCCLVRHRVGLVDDGLRRGLSCAALW